MNTIISRVWLWLVSLNMSAQWYLISLDDIFMTCDMIVSDMIGAMNMLLFWLPKHFASYLVENSIIIINQ